MSKRLNYIDNLRWITVSLLILYHAAMAYNIWGEPNYIFIEESKVVSAVVVLISPWFMPLMFLLAGVSAYFSMQKRGCSSFIRERGLRLGIPLVFGILVITPILSYFADVTHNGYVGGCFFHYRVFFTKLTDLTGYDGGFTLGHLWFIAVLLIISLLSCVVIRITQGREKAAGIIFLLTAVAAFGFKISGKPIVTYFCMYMLGYCVFSDRELMKKISKYFKSYAVLFIVSSVGNVSLFMYIGGHDVLNDICNRLAFVTGILSLISFGQKRLDFSNNFSRYSSKVSYVFYIVHFPVVVLCQFLLSRAEVSYVLDFLLTLLMAYPLTCGICVIVEKSRYVRVLFGMKSRSKIGL